MSSRYVRNERQKDINEVPEASESSGRLGINRRTKNEPVPAIYVASFGCLPLAVEVGRGTPCL